MAQQQQRVHAAIDLKEAAAADHVTAPDRQAFVELENSLDAELNSPRPSHNTIDKLLTIRGDMAHYVKVGPEELQWRAALDEAMVA